MEKVKATFQTLDFLEKAVKAEEVVLLKYVEMLQVNLYELA